jgi:hypothetical protein
LSKLARNLASCWRRKVRSTHVPTRSTLPGVSEPADAVSAADRACRAVARGARRGRPHRRWRFATPWVRSIGRFADAVKAAA